MDFMNEYPWTVHVYFLDASWEQLKKIEGDNAKGILKFHFK